jgi:hypothetical protein
MSKIQIRRGTEVFHNRDIQIEKDYVTIRAIAATDFPEVDQRIIHSVVYENGRFRVDDSPDKMKG